MMTVKPMEKARPKKSLSPRESAVLDLLAWHLNGKIDYRHRSDLNSPQDYAFYRNLVSSVIRYREIYYFFIRTLTGRSIEKLDPEVVVCLMLGLAQMDELSGIHDHAAVNETVNLISFLRKPHLKGFINGNL
ncbi:MAG: transcription antitermination factor NusB, partial [bacterium]